MPTPVSQIDAKAARPIGILLNEQTFHLGGAEIRPRPLYFSDAQVYKDLLSSRAQRFDGGMMTVVEYQQIVSGQIFRRGFARIDNRPRAARLREKAEHGRQQQHGNNQWIPDQTNLPDIDSVEFSSSPVNNFVGSDDPL
jgi:hypothetical protein